MSVILHEEIGKTMFATRKSLVYRIRLINDGKTIRIIYKHCDVIVGNGIDNRNGNTCFYEDSFKNEYNAVKAFEDVLNKLNTSTDDEYINFSKIFNCVKIESNKLLINN